MEIIGRYPSLTISPKALPLRDFSFIFRDHLWDLIFDLISVTRSFSVYVGIDRSLTWLFNIYFFKEL